MKYAHIGLVALVAVMIAGCGGGSSSKQGSDTFTVGLTGVSQSALGNIAGITYPVDEDGERKVSVPGGTITLNCPDGGADCMITVSRVNGRYVAQSTVDGATATFRATPRTNTNDQNQEIADKDDEIETLKGEVQDLKIRNKRNEAKDIFPRLASGEVDDISETSTAMIDTNYRAKAKVGSGFFGVSAKDSSGSSDGNWYITRFETSDNEGNEKILVIYSDVGSPTRDLLSELPSEEGGGFAAAEIPGVTGKRIQKTLDSSEDAEFISSSSFRGSPLGEAKSLPNNFDIDRGENANPCTGENGACEDSEDNNPANDFTVVRHPGTYRGVSGFFQCTGGSCTATRNGEQNYTLGGGTWTFDAAPSARISVPDKSHTHFGWWKDVAPGNATDSDSGTHEFEFDVFFRTVGRPETLPANFDALSGVYTYRGRATGWYALYSPALPNPAADEFTADVMLQATFNGSVDGVGSISGDITDISGQPNWSLKLVEGTIEDDGTFEETSNGVEWTIGGRKRTGGSWDGTFNFDQEKLGALPSAAVGKFSGEYAGDGRIVGVFGAHKQ